MVSCMELRNREGVNFGEKEVRSVFNMVIFEEPVDLASGNAQGAVGKSGLWLRREVWETESCRLDLFHKV